MKNSNREFLLDAIADFPELKDLPHIDELIARQIDDATFAPMEAAFMAEMDAHNPKASDLVCKATDAMKATPDKAPTTTPAPASSSKAKPITIRVSGAVIGAYMDRALTKGTGYQTLMNLILKAAAVDWATSVEAL